MAFSMTGYGRHETLWQNVRLAVEIRSVNHRFCEIIVRSPRHLMLFEEAIKQQVQAQLRRGRVELFITCNTDAFVKKKVQVDWELAAALLHTAKQVQEKFDVAGQLTIQDLVSREELFQIEEDVHEVDEAFGHVLLDAVGQATRQLIQMRENEGMRLVEDLHTKLETVRQYTSEITRLAPDMKEMYAERLEAKLRELLDQRAEVDEARFLTEIGIFAEKVDIDEELTRLASHTTQFEQVLRQNDAESIGRKLDFLVQEMNREVNTIGSKAYDIRIRQAVVELKSWLEKIKEQVQNIE